MFPLEFIMAHTHLSRAKIHRFEKTCHLNVQLIQGAKYYTLQDLTILRLIRFLEDEGIPLKNIERAAECIQLLKPEESLSSLTLYHDGHSIIDMTTDITILLDKYGQMILTQLKEHELKQVGVGGVLSQANREAKESIAFLNSLKDPKQHKRKPLNTEKLLRELRAS